MSYNRWIATCLADACKAGPATPQSIRLRAATVLGEQPKWLPPLIKQLCSRFGDQWEDTPAVYLAEFIVSHQGFQRGCASPNTRPHIRFVYFPGPAEFPAASPIAQFDLPRLGTESDLIRWLNLSANDLAWLSAVYGNTPEKSGKMRHYYYRWIEKRRGGTRLLEAPKPALKNVQRKIHRQILSPAPLHAAAHAFRPTHSCVTHAGVHVDQPLILKFDLKDFFPSVGYRQVYRVYRRLGYAHSVARLLSKLSTHTTPQSVLVEGPAKAMERGWEYYRRAHLPQGAPSSPALANLVAGALDRRLSLLAASMGRHYSRYADDFVISGGHMSASAIEKLQALVGAIAWEEGFVLNPRKSAVIGKGGRQQVTGIVVNKKLNISRKDYDALKATLYNCVRYGPEGQNRKQCANFQAHLRGKIAHVQAINPEKAEKLLHLYNQIEGWN